MRSAQAAICCRTLETDASCESGWVKLFAYWMKDWISPGCIVP